LAANHPVHASDRDCPDFANQAAAQAYFVSLGGPASDPDRLDADGDGIACESLPCPCSTGSGTPTPKPTPQKPSSGLTCGKERWSVKTLSDSAAGRVNFRSKAITVKALRKKHSPGVGRSDPRIPPVETSTYRVKAQLVEMKREDDRDIHLVIAAPDNRALTMIVEFPDVKCQGAKQSKKRDAMRNARAALERACGQAPARSFRRLSGTATIAGVGFFDVKHGQTGVAPNGIELHPVLRFKSANCGGATSKRSGTKCGVRSNSPLDPVVYVERGAVTCDEAFAVLTEFERTAVAPTGWDCVRGHGQDQFASRCFGPFNGDFDHYPTSFEKVVTEYVD
jgi:hypothetical protein